MRIPWGADLSQTGDDGYVASTDVPETKDEYMERARRERDEQEEDGRG